MEFFDVIEHRHSLRKFTERRIDSKTINKIMAAVLKAPSSKNTRSSRFIIIEDRKLLEAISKMRDSGSGFVTDAPLGIIVAGDKELTDLWVDNASISATFLQLSAEAEGLGSCWVHINGRSHNREDASQGTADDYLRKIMNIPENWGLLCIVALGYSPYSEVKPRPATDDRDKIIHIK